MSSLNEDCLRIIFSQLQEGSLYSCILVNKFWCYTGIPILWKNPYEPACIIDSFDKLYEVVINLLPASSKQLLIDNNIISPSTVSSNQPLFNYISFSSVISSCFINYMLHTLIKRDDVKFHEKYVMLEQEIYKLFINNCKNIKEFNWVIVKPIFQYPGASTCFSQLRTLDVQVTSDLLIGMAQICQNIEDLRVSCCDKDLTGLTMFIDVQKNLQSLILHTEVSEHLNSRKNVEKKQCEELSKVIEKKVATLKSLDMKSEWNETLIIPKTFPLLINLETLKIRDNCTYEEWSKYLLTASFPNLQYLKIQYLPLCVDYKLVENSGGNILGINVS